jgi:DNA-binding NtrC family response regulator
MTNKVIWLIDDDHIYHIIMKKIIDRSGVSSNVVSFKNGRGYASARKLSKTVDNFRFNFIDIEMPVLDGWGFMNEWKQVKERLSQKYKSIYQVLPSRLKTNKSENNPDILDMSKPISMEDLLLISNKD